ncbi:MAG: hypothetical protein NTW50_03940 [Candidatus Berkelbacteria bacterium]|nr:hypothetical protein [Candidatus Berkelbacteria bacterium]
MARKLLSFLCQTILIFALIVLGLASLLRFGLMNPKFYQNLLKQSNIYSEVIHVAPSFISGKILEDPASKNLALSQSDLANIFDQSVTPAWLESNFNLVSDQVFAYLSGKSDKISAIIDLHDISAKLNFEIGQSSVANLGSIRPCTKAEENAIVKNHNSKTGQITLSCLPSFLEIADVNSGTTSSSITTIESYDLGHYLIGNRSKLDQARVYYQKFNLCYDFLIVFVLLILTAIFFLNSETVIKSIYAVCSPFVTVSIILAIVSLIGLYYTPIIFGFFRINLSSEVVDLVTKIVGFAATLLFKPLLNIALLVLIIAIVTEIIAKISTKTKSRHKLNIKMVEK